MEGKEQKRNKSDLHFWKTLSREWVEREQEWHLGNWTSRQVTGTAGHGWPWRN